MTAEDRAYTRIAETYGGPFHRQWPDGAGGAGLMLDVVSDAIFDLDPPAIRTASKETVFSTYLEPFEGDEESTDVLTPEGAAAALSFLVKQNMVVVEGDMISIHPRFADMFSGSSAPADANEGAVLVS